MQYDLLVIVVLFACCCNRTANLHALLPSHALLLPSPQGLTLMKEKQTPVEFLWNRGAVGKKQVEESWG